MSLLKKIRNNNIANSLLRNILKKSSTLSTEIHRFLINRWPPSGIIDCNFNEYNFKLYNKCDDGLPKYFFYNLPYQEKSDLKLFIELSKKSECIVDIGANTGLFSVLSSIANSNSRIYSIEPYRINAERMKVNLNLNYAKNVSVHELAIGDINGEIQLSIPENNSITDVSSINRNFSKKIYPYIKWSSQNVKIKTLDDFAIENKIQINLIKCDVETYEMPVFKGADRILRESKPTIIFECFLDDERKIFFNNILVKYNYYVYLILDQGVVHLPEGFTDYSIGLNYLITPIKPSQSFIRYNDVDRLCEALLLQQK